MEIYLYLPCRVKDFSASPFNNEDQIKPFKKENHFEAGLKDAKMIRIPFGFSLRVQV